MDIKNNKTINKEYELKLKVIAKTNFIIFLKKLYTNKITFIFLMNKKNNN